jgi:hypothetical protein
MKTPAGSGSSFVMAAPHLQRQAGAVTCTHGLFNSQSYCPVLPYFPAPQSASATHIIHLDMSAAQVKQKTCRHGAARPYTAMGKSQTEHIWARLEDTSSPNMSLIWERIKLLVGSKGFCQ